MHRRIVVCGLGVLLATGQVCCSVDLPVNPLEGKPVGELRKVLTKESSERMRVDAIKALDKCVPALPARGTGMPAKEEKKQPEIAGQDVINALTDALSDSSCAVRGYAMKALARVGAPAVPGLIKALQSDSTDVRAYAAGALSEMSRYAAAPGLPPEGVAVPALTVALNDKDYSVRVSAARALGRMKTYAASALPKLIVLLKDEEWAVVDEAVQAVAAVDPGGTKSVPALVNILSNKKHDVREIICNELNKIGTNAVAAIPELVKQLDVDGMDWYASKAAAETLVAIDPAGKRVVGPIAESIFKGKQSFVKKHLLFALFACKSDFGPEIKPAIPFAIEWLKKAAVSSEGMSAPLISFLQKAGPQVKGEIVPAIKELIKNSKLNQKAARKPLEELLKKLEG